MGQERCDGEGEGRSEGRDEGRDEGRGDAGPPESRFLDLEISKVLFGEAEGITRAAFRELLKDAAKDRLRERFGERIRTIAHLAVDELMEDVLANLAIEAKIRERDAKRRDLQDRVRAILGGGASGEDSHDGD